MQGSQQPKGSELYASKYEKKTNLTAPVLRSYALIKIDGVFWIFSQKILPGWSLETQFIKDGNFRFFRK